MRKTLLILVFISLVLPQTSSGWGKTGHRVVGQIAYNHMTKKARKNIQKFLGNESLANAGNWMDFIRSDKDYDHQTPWHYCTIPDSLTYEEAGAPEEGDVIIALEKIIGELKSKNFSENELWAIRCLAHLIADIHQPLHVGNGKDRGGNDLKLKYMYQNSNLHRVWDSGMIDHQQLSFTEYTATIDFATPSQVEQWQKVGVREWALESKSYREQVYEIPEDKFLTYKYTFDNIETVNLRLLQAGIRLAGILNDIYG
ncbi:MAG: S1/P1 nuclease [Cyclobacteriaceae bacterium]